MRFRFLPPALAAALFVIPDPGFRAEIYVTEPSGVRWNDVGGVRWNDVGGVRWNDVGGIRWNDVGGVRWNDVGGILFTEASGVRWNDVGGVRWNDVGSIVFTDPVPGGPSIDLELMQLVSILPDSSYIDAIVTYQAPPSAADLARLTSLGIPGGTIFRRLPMVVVNARRDQIAAIAALPGVRSIYANRTLSIFDETSRSLVGLDEAAADPALSRFGLPLTGSGVTIAVIDSGVDATHPDLPYGLKVVENVRLGALGGAGIGFTNPIPVEGLPNTDLLLGHGTFVASVAAGTGQASAGRYRGVAPGAGILSLSAGDLFIINVLEGFDYVLDTAARFNTRVVNCSWGTQGFFDPDDPVNIATRILHDAGITVVFAAGNHGPSPDTLNPYAVAPWVIGVGSTNRNGSLSSFSSRGIFEELIYHPAIVAPGEGIIAASPVALNAVYGVVGVIDPAGGVTVPPGDAAYYVASSGTSFAAPHVAGVAALMLELDPTLTPADIKRILMKTATPILSADRSQVGAGLLDGWAALTQTVDAARPFGSHYPGWLDQRPWTIDYRSVPIFTAVAPAAGSIRIPAGGTGASLAWEASLAWGTTAGLTDLDLRVLDSTGTEVARSESLDGPSLYGRTEGVRLLGSVPGGLTLEVYFRQGLADQIFHLRRESADARLTGFTDLADLPPSDLAVITAAVSRRLMIGRGSRFEASGLLTRGELARALALAARLPQRIPALPSFADVPASDPESPYIETVAGARARRVLITPRNGATFGRQSVDRIDFAVAMVRAAGREAEAIARAGETLGLLDEWKIPPELRGYVAVALERGLIEPIMVGSGLKLDPDGSITRLDASRFLLRQSGWTRGAAESPGAHGTRQIQIDAGN